MNDEQLHQNSLEIGRKLIEKAPELRGWVESKLPELKESEDNRIIKSIIEFVKQNNSFTCCKGVSKDDCIAWLKKQMKHECYASETMEEKHRMDSGFTEMMKYHKSVEEKNADLEKEIDRWLGCEAFPEGTNITPLPKAMDIVRKTAEHFANLYTVSKWSKEDERIRQSLLESVIHYNNPDGLRERDNFCSDELVESQISWLKSLKPKYWKPSIEQMSFLYSAICAAEESKSYHTKKILETLYHDLEKI